MTWFYSRSLAGFCHTSTHGTREIEVVDESRQSAELADCTVRELALDEVDDADARAISQQDIDAYRREVLINPPMMMVANPACKLPDDAVEIDDATHASLMDDQANGFQIVAEADGRPVSRPIQITPEQLMTNARAARDHALRQSDPMMMPDRPLSAEAKKAWKSYRQKLRDFPDAISAMLADRHEPESVLSQLPDLVRAGRPS